MPEIRSAGRSEAWRHQSKLPVFFTSALLTVGVGERDILVEACGQVPPVRRHGRMRPVLRRRGPRARQKPRRARAHLSFPLLCPKCSSGDLSSTNGVPRHAYQRGWHVRASEPCDADAWSRRTHARPPRPNVVRPGGRCEHLAIPGAGSGGRVVAPWVPN